MHRIPCPDCGLRDEAEFVFRGDARVTRPRDADVEGFYRYVYERENPKGWSIEWWQHVGGCRQWLKVVRHTVTHEIRAVARANEQPKVPDA